MSATKLAAALLAAAAAAPSLAQGSAAAPSVTIGELARAQARAIEGELSDLLARLKVGSTDGPGAAAAAQPPAQAASGLQEAEKKEEPRAVRPSQPVIPKRTHIVFLGLYGEEGNVTLEFELPDGRVVQRKSGDRIGGHSVVVAQSGRVILVGNGMREVRAGEQFN
jgi:hypothetical protein